jgi:hypothetical protein
MRTTNDKSQVDACTMIEFIDDIFKLSAINTPHWEFFITVGLNFVKQFFTAWQLLKYPHCLGMVFTKVKTHPVDCFEISYSNHYMVRIFFSG